MGVDDDDAVGTGCADEVGDGPGAYGVPWVAAPVLPCVPEIGDDRGHSIRVTPPASIDQQHQLDQVSFTGGPVG